MKNKRLSLCLVLVLMPLLASCAGAMRSFDRATGGKEDGGERYLVNENKEWETILGCKSEQFRVIQEKDIKTPDWLLRQYIYARCGNYFVYGDFKNSIVLNLETGRGVKMKQTFRNDRLNDIEILPIDSQGRKFKEEFKGRFKTAQFDEEELLWLLNRAENDEGFRVTNSKFCMNFMQPNCVGHYTGETASRITHLFYATYVDPLAVQHEDHIQHAIQRFRQEKKKTFQGKKVFNFPKKMSLWDIGDKTNPLSLLAKLHNAIEADPSKLEELASPSSSDDLWLKALDVEN